MGARMLVTRTGRPAFGRWTPAAGRPPALFLLFVLLLLLAAVVAGPVAGATGVRGPEEICLGTDGSAGEVELSFFRDLAGGVF